MLFKATAALRTVSPNTQTGLMITIGTLQKKGHAHIRSKWKTNKLTACRTEEKKYKRNSKHCQLPNKRLGEEKSDDDDDGGGNKNNNNALGTTAINNGMLKHSQTFEIDN